MHPFRPGDTLLSWSCFLPTSWILLSPPPSVLGPPPLYFLHIFPERYPNLSFNYRACVPDDPETCILGLYLPPEHPKPSNPTRRAVRSAALSPEARYPPPCAFSQNLWAVQTLAPGPGAEFREVDPRGCPALCPPPHFHCHRFARVLTPLAGNHRSFLDASLVFSLTPSISRYSAISRMFPEGNYDPVTLLQAP